MLKHNIIFLLFIVTQIPMMLFDFNSKSDISNWSTVDDVVMGGRSNGSFKINDAGNGLFFGKVSLENNGGFSMVQYHFETKNVTNFSKVYIRLKGDGKPYQFRVKTNTSDRHSYVAPFNTSGDWEIIEISFETLSPAFRGRKLDIPNYEGNQMEMLAFLIGNKKAESFSLEIDSIVLK
ncbi:CIA30 family protein [uncultured Algibacter sp.]|uniref:CIA30 family protein n=1 Tax=uncultured Algibacter sp. TaxID=298659 RepID=UPI00260F44DF|nr:CIA30 family protein [uncultured Algibacter sp.]